MSGSRLLQDGSPLQVVLLQMSNGTMRARGIEEWQQQAERPSVTHAALLSSIFAPCLPCKVKTQHTKKIAQTWQRFPPQRGEPLRKHVVLHRAALKICLCIPNWAQILLVLREKWQFREHFLFPRWQWKCRKETNMSWECANWVMQMVMIRQQWKGAIIGFSIKFFYYCN